MFSFHKPKVYRSSTGCCICKAKSSSSRFTDSRKYEDDFVKCFQLQEARSGEICNACVLLVKRWKKLPPDSDRNWKHVVDARAGPGIKSMTKFKAKNKRKSAEEDDDNFDQIIKKKHVYKRKNVVNKEKEREQSPAMSDDLTDGSSRVDSPANANEVDDDMPSDDQVSGFIDLDYFKKTKVCCGVVFIGKCNELVIQEQFYKPCAPCINRQKEKRMKAMQATQNTSIPTATSPAHSSASSLISSPSHSSSASPPHSEDLGIEGGKASDSSSDSGYDDISPVGSLLNSEVKKPPPSNGAATTVTHPEKRKSEPMDEDMPFTPAVRLAAPDGTKLPIKLLCKPIGFTSTRNGTIASVPKAN